MTYDSVTLIVSRHQRTIFIAALIVIGFCLLAATVWLSLCVPMAIENEGSLVEGLYRPP
ncbi:MAG TPA: hypothetical protein VGV07_26040 [Devosia sp.]|jgi:hypothetical protein|uniref:hypothetical protein n=1 Tax=Devosia sp. TaxID=1871048 RepID=UPI002DDD060E|nr:hypothetical protein [Devosia sp.]HEV2518734.1 hypothetical protein [Devosia sp.]